MGELQPFITHLLESNSLLAYAGAFLSGSITAAAPCSLVAVPLLVGSAVALNKDLEGRKKVLYTYLFTTLFALGVALSFSILGFIVAKFGGFFSVAPMWAYLVAGIVSILIALYAFGMLGEVDKSAIIHRLIHYRLFGGFLIGLIFGLVSTPCASAPLFAIMSLAGSSGYLQAYGLILTFALGHSLLLLIAGVSVGFAQSITSSSTMAKISDWINKGFALLLLGFGLYFFYEAYLQL
ncbi:cytochrome c biogenesis CcdA family protein [Sulfurovum sp. NBC37-1]|uniref:cytochrome c biogenesis CcdA family protein n=1 Tax=Sulfurovum sp. (strain NBC37-1) TaxID=387093 RepID=UPI000158794C|nr:cytochrome c biogenesis protein CcdA [Sulfurovum sp. NBC37-1]BAF72367.1 cytochrome c biogenesis protein [Sulfurovum sp. NBC37-1]